MPVSITRFQVLYRVAVRNNGLTLLSVAGKFEVVVRWDRAALGSVMSALTTGLRSLKLNLRLPDFLKLHQDGVLVYVVVLPRDRQRGDQGFFH